VIEADYGRNLIGGRWLFPAAPYEYEIRSPRDSSVVATVPLSSRFDVARAVAVARQAAREWAAEPDERRRVLARIVADIESAVDDLAAVQARETGLSTMDSLAATRALAQWCRHLLATASAPTQGVSGHVLSWGLPLAEAATAVLPPLLAGRTVVVKPSLRAPLSAIALAAVATRAGLPAGVLNVVQGTGPDVGAALINTPELAALHVRGSERTIAAAQRGTSPTVPLRAGGNIAVAGAGADPESVAATVLAALRLHSAGGPLSLPMLAVHHSLAAAVGEAVRTAIPACRPAPLPTEPMRRKALAYARHATIPDDIEHRMGWLMPPVVVTTESLASTPEPIGPVLTIAAWREPDEVCTALTHPRYRDGIACVWDAAGLTLPQQSIMDGEGPVAALTEGRLPPAWTGMG
jgi:acyl-CoA reductase-like NAD-dependent aldehyde dehydrogenase